MFTEIYAVTLGQGIAALSPSIVIAALFNPFLLVLFSVFCGVTAPPATLPYFWRSWMWPLDPFTRLISGLVTSVLYEQPVVCETSEFNVFRECGLPSENFHLTAPQLRRAGKHVVSTLGLSLLPSVDTSTTPTILATASSANTASASPSTPLWSSTSPPGGGTLVSL